MSDRHGRSGEMMSSADTSRRAGGTERSLFLTIVGASMIGLNLAWLVGGGLDWGSEMTIFLVAGPVGALFGLLAIVRFEWFVWAVLLIRPSLDAFPQVGGVGVGAMLAAMFLLVSSVWLLTQRRAGEWTRLSPASSAMLVFASAVGLAIVTSIVRVASVRAALEIVAGMAMFLVLEQLLPDRIDRLRRLVSAVLLSAVIPLIVAFQQWFTGTGATARSVVPRVYGTFVHPNPFATYLVLMIILAVTVALTSEKPMRWVLMIYSGLIVLIVIQTYNRAGWISLVVALAYIGYRRSKWILVGFVAAAVAVAVFVPAVSERFADLSEEKNLPEGVPQNSLDWRIQYWGELIPLTAESPLTGIGPQAVLNTRPEGLEPHNVLVQTVVETGLFGFVALVAVFLGFAVTLSRRRRNARNATELHLADGAIAAVLSVFVLVPSENLLNATMTWWYLAACATWGFATLRGSGRAEVLRSAADVVSSASMKSEAGT